MSRPVLLALVFGFLGIAFLSCATPESARDGKNRVYVVDAATIFRSYADGFGTWDGQRVEVHLHAKSYTVSAGAVLWSFRTNSDPPSVIFECTPPADNTQPVTVVGVCHGKVFPGGREWHVLVKQCVVTPSRWEP